MDWKLIPATTSRYCYGVTSINWLPSYLASSSILLLLFQPSIQDKTWARNILTHYWNTSVESSQYSTIFFFHARLKHAQLESFHTIVVQHSPETFLHTSETTQNMTKMLSYLNETFIRLMPLKLGHAPENVLIHKIETEVIFFFFTQTRGGVQIGNLEKIFQSVFPGWSCPLRHASRCLHCYKNCQIATTDTFSHYWVFINSWAKLKSSHAHYWNAFTLYWNTRFSSVYENSSVVFEKSSLLNWTLSSS